MWFWILGSGFSVQSLGLKLPGCFFFPLEGPLFYLIGDPNRTLESLAAHTGSGQDFRV